MSNITVRSIDPNELGAYDNKIYRIINKKQNANHCSSHNDQKALTKISLPHNNFVIYDIHDISTRNKNALLFVITDGTDDSQVLLGPSHILEIEFDISLMAKRDELIIIVLNDHPKDFYTYEKPLLHDLINYIDNEISPTDIDIDQCNLDKILDKYIKISKEIPKGVIPKSPKEAAGGIIIK
jgi:hypothetical protein